MPDPVSPVSDLLPRAADEVVREGLSLGVSPEAEGKALDASVRAQVPLSFARDNEAQLDGFMRQDRRMRAYQRDLDLAAWVASNPSYADISRDDELALQRLKLTTDAWRARAYDPTTGEKWAAGVRDAAGGVSRGIGQLGRAGYGVLSAAAELSGWAADDAQVLRDLAEIAPDSAVSLKAELHGVSFAEMMRRENKASAITPLSISFNVPVIDRGVRITAGDLSSGAMSLAPTFAAGAATGGALWAVLGAAGLQSAGGMYADLREAGDGIGSAAGKATLAGGITAGLTALFPTAEKGIAAILRGAVDKKVATRAVLAGVLGKRAAGEASEESIDEFAQSIIRGEPIADAVAAGVKAGLIGGVLGGAVGVGEARQARHSAMVDATLAHHKSLDDLVRDIDGTKTGARSKEAIKSFLQTARPELKDAPAVFAADELAPVMEDPQVAEDLIAIGITKEAVAAAAATGGSVRSTVERIIVDLPAETREKIRPLMKESADGLSRPEAEAAAEEVKVQKAAGSEVDEEAKRVLKDIKKEQSRLAKELKAATKNAMTPADIETVLQVRIQAAYTLATRDAGHGRTALAALQKLTFAPDEKLTPEEVRQRISDTAEDGKTALRGIRVADSLGSIAARVDLLTGRISINPRQLVDQKQVDKILAQARGKALDLKGRKVKVETEAGAADVDADAVVGTIRERDERMSRLRECLG